MFVKHQRCINTTAIRHKLAIPVTYIVVEGGKRREEKKKWRNFFYVVIV